MAQLLRREDPERVSHITSRTPQQRLWFVNNPKLEQRVLGYLGRLVAKYTPRLYAFALMGNHFHAVAQFPLANRAHFMRDFKSQFQRYLTMLVEKFLGGAAFYRRYDEQQLPLDGDVEKYFWYTVLQPISSGLCDNLRDAPQYNCFHDAICGSAREVEYFAASEYYRARCKNPAVPKSKFIHKYKLTFERLPGYEQLSQHEYRELMLKKYAEKRIEALEERAKKGIKSAIPLHVQKRIKPGSFLSGWRKRNARDIDREAFRPIVLSECAVTRAACLAEHFAVAEAHREASRRYRAGELSVAFPPGTYRPPLLSPPLP